MCCTWLAEITGRNNYAKKSPSGHHRTILSGYIFATNAHINNRKNLLNRNISPTCPCPHNMTNFGLLAAEIGLGVLGNPPPRISTGFAPCLRLCSDVAHRRPTKLCTMFRRSWTGTLCIHFRLYCQRYCMALQQRVSAKLCVVAQGMELQNFRRGATYIRLGGHHVGPIFSYGRPA